jgi:hypothetical protein
MPQAPKRASADTRALADINTSADTGQNEFAPTDADDTKYLETVAEGKAIVASISGKQWELGDLAAQVVTAYGENSLVRYTLDISRLGQHAGTMPRRVSRISKKPGPAALF